MATLLTEHGTREAVLLYSLKKTMLDSVAPGARGPRVAGTIGRHMRFTRNFFSELQLRTQQMTLESLITKLGV